MRASIGARPSDCQWPIVALAFIATFLGLGAVGVACAGSAAMGQPWSPRTGGGACPGDPSARLRRTARPADAAGPVAGLGRGTCAGVLALR
jgi:hypothetical protein